MVRLSFGWLFIAFIADLFSLFVLADAIGAWWTLLWVLVAMLIGILIILDAGDTLTSLGGLFATPSERMAAIKETPWLVLVGVLFFIPGVISDFVAVLLWLPSLRHKWFKTTVRARPARSVDEASDQHDTQTTSHATIIEGEWVEKPVHHTKPNALD